MSHLFERFYRIEADRSRGTGGAGLGLAIAAEITRWHNGKLDVQSAMGFGTTFTVVLPLTANYAEDKNSLRLPSPIL